MSKNFQPLSSGEVLSVSSDSQIVIGHSTFRVSEFTTALKQLMLEHGVGGVTPEKIDWLTADGIDCDVLRFGSDGWVKGKVRLHLEFCEEGDGEVSPDPKTEAAIDPLPPVAAAQPIETVLDEDILGGFDPESESDLDFDFEDDEPKDDGAIAPAPVIPAPSFDAVLEDPFADDPEDLPVTADAKETFVQGPEDDDFGDLFAEDRDEDEDDNFETEAPVGLDEEDLDLEEEDDFDNLFAEEEGLDEVTPEEVAPTADSEIFEDTDDSFDDLFDEEDLATDPADAGADLEDPLGDPFAELEEGAAPPEAETLLTLDDEEEDELGDLFGDELPAEITDDDLGDFDDLLEEENDTPVEETVDDLGLDELFDEKDSFDLAGGGEDILDDPFTDESADAADMVAEADDDLEELDELIDDGSGDDFDFDDDLEKTPSAEAMEAEDAFDLDGEEDLSFDDLGDEGDEELFFDGEEGESSEPAAMDDLSLGEGDDDFSLGDFDEEPADTAAASGDAAAEEDFDFGEGDDDFSLGDFDEEPADTAAEMSFDGEEDDDFSLDDFEDDGAEAAIAYGLPDDALNIGEGDDPFLGMDDEDDSLGAGAAASEDPFAEFVEETGDMAGGEEAEDPLAAFDLGDDEDGDFGEVTFGEEEPEGAADGLDLEEGDLPPEVDFGSTQDLGEFIDVSMFKRRAKPPATSAAESASPFGLDEDTGLSAEHEDISLGDLFNDGDDDFDFNELDSDPLDSITGEEDEVSADIWKLEE